MSFNDEYQKLRKKRLGVEESVSSDDDIAPVDRKWFQKGAFEDGYQFGDVLKTVGSSARDLKTNAMAGILGIGETVVDAGAYLVGGVGGLFSEDFKEKTKDFIVKDLYDEKKVAEKLLGWQDIGYAIGGTNWVDTNEYSVFGDRMDSLAQSGGQLLGTMALRSVGVPWFVTSGVTSFGGEVENAFHQGATYREAGLSGAISAGVELATEKLFGGSGLGEKGLINLEPLTKGISNKIAKAFVDFGVDMAAEGMEEVAAQFANNFASALYKEENLNELLFSEEAFDGYLESFIGGAALGSFANVGKAVSSAKTGTDYRSGLTSNEQAVFDKVYNDRIAAAEENGEKLTGKDKRKIYDEVMEDLAKGGISIDDIESALGGDTYMEYKNTVYEEDNLQKEFDELGDMKEADFTAKQRDRYNELKQLISESKAKDTRGQLKSKLHENVFSLAKDSAKLSESYLEKDRRSQAYTDDFSAYDEKEKETVQKAIDSGILNNTRRTHEFVRTLAKLAKETGKTFDFTNNAKLKESGFAVDGKTVNGFYTKEGITVNMDSHKAWQSTVGHEVTHVLEGTELYGELQKALFEYAKSKNDYQGRYDALKELYKGVEGADIDAELTADLVGDYLFTDSDFVNNLSVTNRNVFQKIYDEIKHLMKLVTAGSKEARQLEKVKRTFDKAYQENGKAKENTADGGVKYSIVNLEDGKIYVEASRNVINGTTRAEQRKDITNFFNELLGEKSSIDVQTIEGDVLTITKTETANKARDDYKTVDGKPIKMTDEEFAVKLHIESHIDEVAEVSAQIGEKSDNKNHTFAKDGFTYRRAYFKDFDGQYYEVTLSIGNNGTVATVYNVGKIKEGVPPSAKIIAVVGSKPLGKTPSNNSIPQNSEKSSDFAKNSLSFAGEAPVRNGTPLNDLRLDAPMQEDIGPVREDISQTETTTQTVTNMEQVEDYAPMEDIAPRVTEESSEIPTENTADFDAPIITMKQKLNEKQRNYQKELDKNKQLHDEAIAGYDAKIAKAQAEYDAKKDKTTKTALALARRIERLKRLKGNRDAEFKKAINDIESRMAKNEDQLLRNHDRADRFEKYKRKAEKMFEAEKSILAEEFEKKKATLREQTKDKNAYISNRALELYNELSNLKKGVKASKELGYLLDHGFDWNSLKSTLLKVNRWSSETVNPDSVEESTVREMLNEDFKDKVYELDDIDTEYDEQVEVLKEEFRKKYESFKVANQRMTKQQEYSDQMEELVGDTSTWVDKKMGIFYKINTLRRNLRDIVRDANGNRDIAKADAIYDELQGKYNQHEASLNRESNSIKKPYADMNITKDEDVYIQMLGEFRHNPDTTLTEDVVKDFYEKNKDNIDAAKVDKVIEEARKTYDTLLERVNEVLREQGMKEIPYRQGYFPHFTEEKQGLFAKLINWKTQNNDIPTDIAGLTEQFNPNRSWQSFNKQRTTDATDYSFTKGLDTYVHGALDWIYHIEDIQKRRALENHIRYIHSEQGVKEKIEAIQKNENYDADEMQDQIDLVYKTAGNPLNNFVADLRAGTNRLANKKSSMDRGMEEMTNRKIYSTMTNISNRVNSNLVAGSISSAFTNFIPITQSWGQVSPFSSLRAMGDTIKSIARDDGVVDKSDFLTNRLRKEENLYKTTWDKVGDKLGLLMEGIDNFTSQTVWRSKYLENISKGMSESDAIKNADQFAANVIADRSRGNMPTAFDSKNPLIKVLTAFQLEVNNQYGYMFKDMPQDVGTESKGKLVKGYAAMFIGAYAYNALYSSLTGRNAAFDPISIIKELLEDLFGDDEEEEPIENIMGASLNLADNLLEETPFVGGLLGGGRIPISSALPYDGVYEMLSGTMTDIAEKDWSGLTKEWLNPAYYLAMPMGGGQLKKTIEGLSMFSDDHPVAGSYTNSGDLRFPVDDSFGSKVQAALFGQYASKNARDYFDNDWAPLKESRIQEYIATGLPIAEYRKYSTKLSKIEADHDKNGNAINGSRKKKVINYLNGLDIDYTAKMILFKKQYKSDDTYNRDIVKYLIGREDLSYDEKVTILKELGFEVDAEGNISW